MLNIPVIDIFAGPGGLSEGFSRYSEFYRDDVNFNVKLSVEMDKNAHKTLRLRSFFRQFPSGSAPQAYYNYIRANSNDQKKRWRDEIESMPEWQKAVDEVKRAKLGSDKATLYDVVAWVNSAIDREKLWALLGGPPCKAYSVIGRSRQTGIGKEASSKNAKSKLAKLRDSYYSLETHKLYKEYLGILTVLHPPVFVMENVKGILSSKIRVKLPKEKKFKYESVFDHIISDLTDPLKGLSTILGAETKNLSPLLPSKSYNYKIYSFVTGSDQLTKKTDTIIFSEQFGVPQERHRVILLGIRDDIEVTPRKLVPRKEKVSVHQVIGGLPRLRSGRTGNITAKEKSEDQNDTEKSWLAAIKRSLTDQIVDEINDEKVRDLISRLKNRKTVRLDRGDAFIPGDYRTSKAGEILEKWYSDPRLGGVLQHTTRAHMDTDLARYLFISSYGYVNKITPTLKKFPVSLLPDHKNVINEGKITDLEKFSDRFRVQIKNRPATTVTAHLRKDGHYFIHYDPSQCRSISPREAARIQTFPDNYYFEGDDGPKFEQIGNAVPPFLASQLAEVVADIFKQVVAKHNTE